MRWRRPSNTYDGGQGTGFADETRGEPGSVEEIRAEIAALTVRNRRSQDRDTERRLLWLRHVAGLRQLASDAPRAEFPTPATEALPTVEGLPEIARQDLTPELLRAGILRDGCLLVRGFVPRDTASDFAAQIERAFAARARQDAGGTADAGYYEEFRPDPAFGMAERSWVQEGGGVLAVDAPTVAFEMLELLTAAGLPDLVERYLGEGPLLSAHKTTLRRADPSVGGAWHQDGAFMGDVRALNLWLSLSRCGDEAPGLDIVPRRIPQVVVDQASILRVDETRSRVEALAGDTPIVRPVFEPGDALFFDELCLHQTASDPSMPHPRYALESWFFGASAFPAGYAPVAV